MDSILHQCYFPWKTGSSVQVSFEEVDFSVLFFNALTFASDKFGWSSARTDEVLLPVLKQLNKDEVGAFQASKSYVNVPSILI